VNTQDFALEDLHKKSWIGLEQAVNLVADALAPVEHNPAPTTDPTDEATTHPRKLFSPLHGVVTAKLSKEEERYLPGWYSVNPSPETAARDTALTKLADARSNATKRLRAWHASGTLTLTGRRKRMGRRRRIRSDESAFTFGPANSMVPDLEEMSDEAFTDVLLAQEPTRRHLWLDVKVDARQLAKLLENRLSQHSSSDDASLPAASDASLESAPKSRGQFSEAAVIRWIKKRMKARDPTIARPPERDELLAARRVFPGISRDALRKLRREIEPMKAGRPAKKR
jgi:hypothetical protein